MTRSRTAIACLALLGATAFSLPADACERCRQSQTAKTCKNCDDAGLLDAFDAFAGAFQSTLKKTLSPPKKHRHSAGCGSAHCDGVHCDEPGCGCEMHAHNHVHSYNAAPMQPVTPHHHAAPQYHAVPQYQPAPQYRPAPQSTQPAPSYHQPAPSYPAPPSYSAPPSHAAPPAYEPSPNTFPTPAPNLQKLPDREVDPFMDDVQNRVRRPKTLPVKHYKSAQVDNQYRQQFDRVANYRVRLSDSDDVQVQLPTMSVAADGTNGMSREVVPASASERAAAPEPLQRNAPQRLNSSASRIPYSNPLR